MQDEKRLPNWFFLSLFVVVLFFSLQLNVQALSISYPPNNLVSYNDYIFLKGFVQDKTGLRVNGMLIDVEPDGFFEVGLILSPGKNLVLIEADGVVENRKILRLLQFPDVEEMTTPNGDKYWARARIIALTTLGLIEAYPDNNFYPRRNLTRGELATWLARIKGLAIDNPLRDVYLDVPKEHWRAPYIQAVVNLGYMQGLENGFFRIDEGILRGKVAEVILRAEGGQLTGEAEAVFTDVSLNHPQAFFIAQAQKKGFVYGVDENKKVFQPDRFITRAEAGMLLARDPGVNLKVADLFDFDKGFDSQVLCAINTAPKVEWVKIEPNTAYVEDKKVIVITAKIIDQEEFSSLANVTVDLSAILGPTDAKMFDDASNGDQVKDDGIYSLKIVATPTKSGELRFKVKVVDKYTSVGLGETVLTVLE